MLYKKIISMILVTVLLFTSLSTNTYAFTANKTQPNAAAASGTKENQALPQNGADVNTPMPEGSQIDPDHKIIGEINSKRSQFEKQFLLDDKSYEAVVYPFKVNYKTGGGWEEVDNSLISSKDSSGGTYLTNKANDFNVKFTQSAQNDKLVTVDKDKYEVAWDLTGANKAQGQKTAADTSALDSLPKNLRDVTPKNLFSSVSYAGIYEGINLKYDVLPDKVKESLVLTKYTEKPAFNFDITTKNLSLTLENNEISFYDESDPKNAVYKIEAPYMTDAKGAATSDVEMALTKTDTGYTLKITPDDDWLKNPDRAYPVAIDPTLTTSIDSTQIHDSVVKQNYPSTNFASQNYLEAGYDSTDGITRSYLKFDLPSNITSSDNVYYAYVNLHLKTALPSSEQVDAHRVSEDWTDSSITWNSQPSVSAKVDDYQMCQSVGSYSWDITTEVKDWYTTGSNFGIMIKHPTETSAYGRSDFHAGNAADTELRPYVVLNYVDDTGLEDYWSFHSQDVGRAGTTYVNDFTGNIVQVHEDLSMSGNRLPAQIRHVYNSSERSNDIKYGNGWRLNISQRITKVTLQGTVYYAYTDEDGTTHYFVQDGTGKYIDDSGLNLTLTLNADNTYTVTDKTSNSLLFDSSGNLTKITDSNNNAMTLGYTNGILKTVTDGAGRVTTLDTTDQGYLIGVIDPSGKRTSYSYGGTNLTKITYPDGKYTIYQYDGQNKLIKAINYDGYEAVVDYYTAVPFKANKLTENNTDGTQGQELNIIYGYNTTTFTDYKGRKNIYEFNDNGNLRCIKNNDGQAVFYKYASNPGSVNNNKLSLVSKLQSSIKNYLLNHNIETTANWNLDYFTGGTATGSVTAEDKYLGYQSLKITKTNTTARNFYSQLVNLQKGRTYTLSGYIKTKNISDTNGQGAAVFIEYQDSAGTWHVSDSDYINGSKNWDRVSVTFTLPQDAASNQVYARCGIIGETGTAYFDCLQLEDGPVANRYNLVENADMSYGSGTPTFWTRGDYLDSNDTLITSADGDYPQNLDKNCFQMNADSSKAKNIYQVIQVSGTSGDIFAASGWAKAQSVPRNTNRYFALDVGFVKSDDTVEWQVVYFNTEETGWQYVSDQVTAPCDYKSVKLYALYYYNANTAYFDALQLYKEQFGQSYGYDDTTGNMISQTDLSGDTTNYDYSAANDVTKITDPAGNKSAYGYDSNHNITDAKSSENNKSNTTYDNYGNPTLEKQGDDNLNIPTSYTYTDNGNYLKTQTDPSGNTTTYAYDETKGLLNSIKDPNNHALSYGYDANTDDLTSESENVDGKIAVNSYAYQNDNLISILHAGQGYSNSFNFSYDSLGNNTGVSVENQNLVTNSYDREGNLIDSTLGNGYKEDYDYDDLNRVAGIKINGTVRYKYQYDADGNLSISQDLSTGKTLYYVYDLSDRLRYIKDSDGNTTKYTYDSNSDISSVNENINGVNHNTDYTYDRDSNNNGVYYAKARENISTSEAFPFDVNLMGSNGRTPSYAGAPLGSDENTGRSSLSVYEGTTNLLSNSSFESGTTGWVFSDWSGKTGAFRTSTDNHSNDASIENYDSDNLSDGSTTNGVGYQLVTLSQALSQDTKYTLSAYAKRIGGSMPQLSVECLDSTGEAIPGAYWTYTKTIPENQWTRISQTFTLPAGTKSFYAMIRSTVKDNDIIRFDDVQLEQKAFDTNYTQNTSSPNRLTYDLGLNKTSGTMSLWFNTKSDAAQRDIIASDDVSNKLLLLYLSSDNKLRLSVRNSSGTVTALAATNETVNTNTWNYAAVTWQYTNGTLNVTLYLNGKKYTGSTTNFTDFTGSQVNIGSSGSATYELNGNISNFKYDDRAETDGEIQNEYNSGIGSYVSYISDSMGRISSKTIDTGDASYTTAYSYENGTAAKTTTGRLSTISNNGNDISYAYDKNENIKSVTQDNKTISYTYNEINEVTREDNEATGKTVLYSYDVGGNILSKTEYAYTLDLTPVNPTNTYTYTYGNTNWKDELTNYNGQDITYDSIGNPKSYNGWTYTWEGKNLIEAKNADYDITYQYDDRGIRTEKTVNGVTTRYHLDDDKVTYETNGTDKIYYTYDANDQLVSMNLNGTEYYYVYNGQGDVTGLIDNTGTEVVSYTYDMWGKLLSTTGTLAGTVGEKNPYRYRAYRYDAETGLYYLQSRYFNPEWGRFINADSILSTTGSLLSYNSYVYSDNNPVIMIDSDGTKAMFYDIGGVSTTNYVAKSSSTTTKSVAKSTAKSSTKSTAKGVAKSTLTVVGDKTSDKAIKNVKTAKVTKTSIPKLGPAFETETYTQSSGIKAIKTTSKIVGVVSLAITGKEIIDDLCVYKGNNKYAAAGITFLGAGLSVGAGIFISAFLPETVAGIIIDFGVNSIANYYIDLYSDKFKRKYLH